MIDASDRTLEENILITRKSVELAHSFGIAVEAELGHIGGKEGEGTSRFTVVEEAMFFAEKTGIDSLAVAVGTSHGIYKGKPEIDFQRIEEISNEVPIPLVLHGASGLSDDILKECIKCGISKINFATELRCKYRQAVFEAINRNRELVDPRIYGKEAVQAVKAAAEHYITVCGCNNRV